MVEDLVMRARGVFLGAAVGDALGWPQEQNSRVVGGRNALSPEHAARFRVWKRYAGTPYRRYVDTVDAGAYSDDTQLLMATARSVLQAEWFTALTTVELPQFPLYQRGAGGATLRACRSWAAGNAPWLPGATATSHKALTQYRAAGGNGAAMRIAPHAVAMARESRSGVIAAAVVNGIATHGHPRALVGAAVYASAVHQMVSLDGTLEYGSLIDSLLTEQTWKDLDLVRSAAPASWLQNIGHSAEFEALWSRAVSETMDLLHIAKRGLSAGSLANDLEVLDELGTFNRRINGAGTVSAAGALYIAARTAPRPRSGLLRSAYLQNADSDTLASMTGALLGALHGDQWLDPIGGQVQDSEYLERLASLCVERSYSPTHGAPTVRAVSEPLLRAFRDALESPGALPRELPDGRAIESIREVTLPASAKAPTRRWELTASGQTIIVDVQGKTPRAVSQTSSASVSRVSIGARDLDAIVAFYGEGGLGLATERLSDIEVLVDKSLRFVRRSDGGGELSGGLEIEVVVDGPAEIAPSIRSTLSRVTGGARVADPSGNDVRLVFRDSQATSERDASAESRQLHGAGSAG